MILAMLIAYSTLLSRCRTSAARHAYNKCQSPRVSSMRQKGNVRLMWTDLMLVYLCELSDIIRDYCRHRYSLMKGILSQISTET